MSNNLVYHTKKFEAQEGIVAGTYVTFDDPETKREETLWTGPFADTEAAQAFVHEETSKHIAALLKNAFRL